MQAEIDFTGNRIENSKESTAILRANKVHINKQCLKVLEALQRGERLTTASALLKYGIGDLRARARDLLKAGYEVKKKLIIGRYKEYFLEP